MSSDDQTFSALWKTEEKTRKLDQEKHLNHKMAGHPGVSASALLLSRYTLKSILELAGCNPTINIPQWYIGNVGGSVKPQFYSSL